MIDGVENALILPLSHNNAYLLMCKHNLQHNKSIICIRISFAWAQFIFFLQPFYNATANLTGKPIIIGNLHFALTNCVTVYANVLGQANASPIHHNMTPSNQLHRLLHLVTNQIHHVRNSA